MRWQGSIFLRQAANEYPPRPGFVVGSAPPPPNCAQDEKLRVKLRRVPGCPLIYVSRTVLLMEQPSGKTKAEFEKSEVGW